MRSLRLVALTLLIAVTEVKATTLLYQSLADLSAKADAIITATVADSKSVRSSTGPIYTFVTFVNVSALAGEVSSGPLVMRFLGGQIGDEIQHVFGSPTFSPGEELILFATANGKAMVPVVGWTQGILRIVRGDGKVAPTIRDYEGNTIVGIDGAHLRKAGGHESSTPITGSPWTTRSLMNQDASARNTNVAHAGGSDVVSLAQLQSAILVARQRAHVGAKPAVRSVALTDLPVLLPSTAPQPPTRGAK